MQKYTLRIPFESLRLDGDLAIPDGAHGVVLFAHGSGSSRFSSRNRFVASELNDATLATLLMDLLTREEEQIDDVTAHLRFDTELLADRLAAAGQYLSVDPRTMSLPLGIFGASTGGGAALVAAARKPELVKAVVSRGGRPDLAGDALPHVRCPTLLIVGGDDEPVIGMNQQAMRRMKVPAELVVIRGATHLFEESGALDEVARLARKFFNEHLQAGDAKLILDGLDPQVRPSM